ncbi:MAG: 2-amino-4-hydroxy-6-hydroxymethyldihydropteridine diphosphokinase [Bacteroidales bacterium]|nr:2-amino-4-hydroxy-6-hydroxymethyldihydropteridine diphosphokinase [Bacteroidales bacterium]
MNKHEAYIIAGSNIEPREHYLKQALNFIEESEIIIKKKSAVYISEPWGFDAELNFFNQVFKVVTKMSPNDLLNELMAIESATGRIRKASRIYTSRVIDLDILFFDNIVLSKPELIIPHPKIADRRFVLMPLNEIAPDLIHPVLNQSINQLLGNCQDIGKVFVKT